MAFAENRNFRNFRNFWTETGLIPDSYRNPVEFHRNPVRPQGSNLGNSGITGIPVEFHRIPPESTGIGGAG